MPLNKRFFEDLLRDRGMSLRQLAKRMDILPSQLSLTFSGKRRLQMTEAVRISQILGASLGDVLAASGIKELVGRRCKVTGILAGDGYVSAVPDEVVESVTMPDGMPNECSAVQARTAETALGWMDGWIFFCNGPTKPEDVAGRFCKVKLEDGRELLATIRRGYTPGTFNLSGPVNLLNQRVESVHPIFVTKQ